MTYPDNILRGISIPNAIQEDGNVLPTAFYFDYETRKRRSDGLIEQSINWQDDIQAIPFTLAQKHKTGGLQFPCGLAIIPRAEIDAFSARRTVAGRLRYERDPKDDNPYHGNLTLTSDTPKITMKMIAANLAMLMSRRVPQATSQG